MMWQATVSRRELLEIVLSGRKPIGTHFEQDVALAASHPLDRDVLMMWKDDPSLRPVLPALLIVDNSERDALFAQINSNPGGPTPLTAYCRVLVESEARMLSRIRQNDGEDAVIDALVGVSFCEAMAHAGGTLSPSELSPAICKRTVAYAWAKALANGVPVEALSMLVDHWFEAQHLSNGAERAAAMKAAIGSAMPIFSVAAALYFRMPSDSPVSRVCEALVENDEPGLQRHWKVLSSRLNKQVSLSELSESAREDRGAYLQLALNATANSDDWIDAALCGFLATRVSPGSFEHLEFLMERGGAKVAMWYCFFAAVQQPRGMLGFSGGLGSRVVRDIARTDSIQDRPTADIALTELRVLARGGMDSIARRLGHSNEIEIEILPLLNCSFRFSAKQTRQQDLFERIVDVQSNKGLEVPVHQSPVEQLNSIIRSLERLSKIIPETADNHFKTAPRRTRKSAK